MSDLAKAPPSEPGLALLLGPTWSLVLKHPSITLGRAGTKDRETSKAGNAHTKMVKSDSSLSRSHIGRRRLPAALTVAKAPSKAIGEDINKSPLYWIMQWAKQQPPPPNDALFEDNVTTQDETLDTMDLPSFTSLETLQPSSQGQNGHNESKSSSTVHAAPSTSATIATLSSNNGTSKTASTSAMDTDEAPKDSLQQSGLTQSLGDSTSSLSFITAKNLGSTICDVDLGSDPTISRIHASISYDAELCLWDISCLSTNGLTVNGRSIYPRDGPALLPSKSRLQIGSVLFYFLLPFTPSKSAKGEATQVPSPIGSSVNVEQFIVDGDKYEQTASLKTDATSTSTATKKRKRSDRSIVPLKALELVDEKHKAKRKSFGEDVSKRSNPMRSILFGGSNDEDIEEDSWRRFLERPKSNEPLAAPHLSATFDPVLEEYRDTDRLSKYTQQSVESIARAVAVTEAVADSKVGSRGPRSNKPSEGTDASGMVYERPKLTYGQIIHLALETSPEKRMLFPEIAEYVEKTFPYFTTAASGNWHNTVRQQLSHTPDFVRQERTQINGKGKGKGGYWALAHWYEGDTLLPRPK